MNHSMSCKHTGETDEKRNYIWYEWKVGIEILQFTLFNNSCNLDYMFP